MRDLNLPRVGVVTNNLKLVFSDAYLSSCSDVTIIVRKPRFVRRLFRMFDAYYKSASASGVHSPRVIEAQFREDLMVMIMEYVYSGSDLFSRHQRRKVKSIAHPVLSDFNFY